MAENQVVSFNYGEQKDLPAQSDGALLFTTDTKKIFLDINQERLLMGGGTTNPQTPTSEIFGDTTTNYAGAAGFEWTKVRKEDIPNDVWRQFDTIDNTSQRACYYLNNATEALEELKSKLTGLPWESTISLYATNPKALTVKDFELIKGEKDIYKSISPFNLNGMYAISIATTNNKAKYIKFSIASDDWNWSDENSDPDYATIGEQTDWFNLQNKYLYIDPLYFPYIVSIFFIPSGEEHSNRSDSARYILAIDSINQKIWTSGDIYRGWGWEFDEDESTGTTTMGINSYIKIDDFPTIGSKEIEEYSFVTGYNNKATGTGSFVAGGNNNGNGSYTMVGGRNNTVNYGGMATGRGNNVTGQLGAALGQYNTVKGHNSAAIGNNLITENPQEVAVGKYNNSTKNQTLFSVGNGTANKRINAFEITSEGKTLANNIHSQEVIANNVIAQKLEVPNNLTIKMVQKKPQIPELNTLYSIASDNSEWLYAEKYSEVWDGTIADQFAGGTGGENDPYLISTAEQLAAAINMSGIQDKNKTAWKLDEESIIMEACNNSIDLELENAPQGTYTFTITNFGSGPWGFTIDTIYNDIPTTEGTVSYEQNTCICNINKDNITIRVNYSDGSSLAKTKEELISTWNSIIIYYLPFNPYYKLTQNILLNDVSSADWYNNKNNKEWFIGTSNDSNNNRGYFLKNSEGINTEEIIKFSGNIDGNGYKVCGLYYSDGTSSQISGLIPYTASTINIKNLFIDKSYLVSNNYSAILCCFITGTNNLVTIQNCGILENTVVKSFKNDCAGGFVGYLNGSNATASISNCYNIMPVTNYIIGSKEKSGSMVGIGWGNNGIKLMMSNNFGIQPLYEDWGDEKNRFIQSFDSVIKNNYTLSTNNNTGSTATAEKIDETQAKGFMALSTGNMENLNTNETFVATENYPKLSVELENPWELISSDENIMEIINTKIVIGPELPINAPVGTIWIQPIIE